MFNLYYVNLNGFCMVMIIYVDCNIFCDEFLVRFIKGIVNIFWLFVIKLIFV